MAKRIYIVIAEPSAVIRLGLQVLLRESQQINVDVVEVSDIQSLSSLSLRNTPDMLIVNPMYIGHFSTAQIRSDLKSMSLKIVALQSTFVDQSLLQNYDEIISIHDSVEVIVKKVEKMLSMDSEGEVKRELSQREREIIVCVVKGLTNKQIADMLNLSTHTVIAHRRNIANKLQIHSPSGLTIYAIVNKLVDLADIKSSISQGRDAE